MERPPPIHTKLQGFIPHRYDVIRTADIIRIHLSKLQLTAHIPINRLPFCKSFKIANSFLRPINESIIFLILNRKNSKKSR